MSSLKIKLWIKRILKLIVHGIIGLSIIPLIVFAAKSNTDNAFKTFSIIFSSITLSTFWIFIGWMIEKVPLFSTKELNKRNNAIKDALTIEKHKVKINNKSLEKTKEPKVDEVEIIDTKMLSPPEVEVVKDFVNNNK